MKNVIVVDAMGGDFAPDEIVKGAVNSNQNIILVGKQQLITNVLDSLDRYDKSKIEIVNADDVIENTDSPVWAMKNKKNSSLIRSLNLLREGEASGLVSAGNTGALLACSTLMLKRVKGISRPALATVLPNVTGVSLLLDSGANVDCKPIYLEQFAKMGAVYAENVMGIKSRARVGLVNVGTESEKGNSLVKEAFELLNGSDINFIGNIEARDVPAGVADVIVCDGFVGNVLLKHTEGLTKNIFTMLKTELQSSLLSKLGAALSMSAFKTLKKKFDYTEIGGAPLLGLESIVVKAHGSSNAKAIKNAVLQCTKFIEHDIPQKIESFYV